MAEKYSAEDAIISVDGQRITGLASGTFVELEWNSDKYSNEPDAYGENVTRTEMQDETGTITITLKQNSPSLPHLKQLMASGDMVSARAVDGSKAESERNGVRGKECSVERPGFARGDEVEETEVVIKAAKLEHLNQS